MITAPYNFVPLNKEVFYPEWSNQVSHDVPFEDGESGVIDIKITAHSPIFIRDSKDKERFSNFNNKEYIPGSSFKGVIRSVLDIIGYAKLNLSDKRLSYRDLNHPSYKQKAMNGDKIHMGWLTKKTKTWFIDDLGTVTSSNSRIKYDEMNEFLGQDLVNKIRKKREAYEKYILVKDRNKLNTPKGTIVFTGTVGRRKTREFLFPNKIKQNLQVSEKVLDTFMQAYYIDKVDENKNWEKLWSKEIKKGEKIPVFFQLDHNNEIQHFGLSMLYKLPYENTLLDLVQNYQNYDADKADLSDTIFGYVTKDDALKGRVQFSNFPIEKKVTLNQKATLPLSSPRATFFPSYIEQKCNQGKTKNYVTYDNKNAILRGFKFYPPQKEITLNEQICKNHPKVCTSFYPLGKGSTFEGKIRFFNLKKCELGALIASLNFLGNESCYHKIGMGKPYGFGTIKIDIQKVTTTDETNRKLIDIVKYFTDTINEVIGVDLYSEDRIKKLFTLASYTIPDKELKYMELKSFAFAKKPFNRFCLPTVQSTIKKEVKSGQPIQTGISKTKMKKAIIAYWQKKFDIFYHPNQIKEFFSEDGFNTTPKEQTTVYLEHKDNVDFVNLLKSILAFNENRLGEKEKEDLYTKLCAI